MLKQYNFQKTGYGTDVLEKSCSSDSNSKRVTKRLQNRLQGKISNEHLILASTNIWSYKCECSFEMPDMEWRNVALIFMGMVAQVICEQDILPPEADEWGKRNG
jgi:hypothetical protein